MSDCYWMRKIEVFEELSIPYLSLTPTGGSERPLIYCIFFNIINF